ncbi:hypothetical protein CK203_082550 [Vitis vinifera]|uniref:Uncharacterized protein n=1 Tax=Vitis vinifera TaxID=29760 RepID=A0A438DKA3_VITVI|nr:hypothetical protein CK203_082550 [Vitis vinifera]
MDEGVQLSKLALSAHVPILRASYAIDTEEIDWECQSSLQDQNTANTVVSPIIEKVIALLAQKSLYPQMKRKARRLQGKFRLISSFLRELESEELDSRGMAWMEELCDLFPILRVVLAYYNFKCQHKLAMEMDEIHSKILEISVGDKKMLALDTSATCKFQIPEDVMKAFMYYDTNKPVSWWDEMTQMVKAFLSDKRFLIVLDDAHCVSCFNEIIAAFQDTMSGRTMILTTCEMSLLSNLKLRSIHHAWRLRGDDESWVLFTYAMKKDAAITEWSSVLQQFNGDHDLWLFPQDFAIPARRLCCGLQRVWCNQGGKNESPEDIAERCLIKLIAQGMVQMINKKPNGNVNSCRLPDALRQHWLSKAQQATFLQVQANTRSELSQSTGLIHHLADHLDKEDVSFDHIHGGYNIASTSLMPQPKLPRELGKITRLRYLGLRWTFLEMIPSSLSKLQNLQTLDLKHTSINTLPNSIWKMQQLRHLYLSESYLSKFMSQPQASFPTALQTLWGLLIDEETPVKDGLDKLIILS